MEDRIVCHCMEVSYETIKKAIEYIKEYENK